VLVIGCGAAGAGTDALTDASIQMIESDIWLSPRAAIVCDAHSLPFFSGSLDAVVMQAVLDDLVDPWRCVSEIHRVLAPRGLVYVETPFMQPVHDGCYDFTRFSHLGHRCIFRQFDEIASGAVSGPATAMAMLYQSLLVSFARTRLLRAIAVAVARLSGFWLKYIDYFLINRPGALDAACGCYLLGRKSERTLSNRELIGLYRGAQGRAAGGTETQQTCPKGEGAVV